MAQLKVKVSPAAASGRYRPAGHVPTARATRHWERRKVAQRHVKNKGKNKVQGKGAGHSPSASSHEDSSAAASGDEDAASPWDVGGCAYWRQSQLPRPTAICGQKRGYDDAPWHLIPVSLNRSNDSRSPSWHKPKPSATPSGSKRRAIGERM